MTRLIGIVGCVLGLALMTGCPSAGPRLRDWNIQVNLDPSLHTGGTDNATYGVYMVAATDDRLNLIKAEGGRKFANPSNAMRTDFNDLTAIPAPLTTASMHSTMLTRKDAIWGSWNRPSKFENVLVLIDPPAGSSMDDPWALVVPRDSRAWKEAQLKNWTIPLQIGQSGLRFRVAPIEPE